MTTCVATATAESSGNAYTAAAPAAASAYPASAMFPGDRRSYMIASPFDNTPSFSTVLKETPNVSTKEITPRDSAATTALPSNRSSSALVNTLGFDDAFDAVLLAFARRFVSPDVDVDAFFFVVTRAAATIAIAGMSVDLANDIHRRSSAHAIARENGDRRHAIDARDDANDERARARMRKKEKKNEQETKRSTASLHPTRVPRNANAPRMDDDEMR